MKERERERILRVLPLTHRKLFSTRRGCFHVHTFSASHIHDHTAALCNFNSPKTRFRKVFRRRSFLYCASGRGNLARGCGTRPSVGRLGRVAGRQRQRHGCVSQHMTARRCHRLLLLQVARCWLAHCS